MSKLTMNDLKSEFIDLAVKFFENQSSNILSDVWDIALPIIENLMHIDINHDGVRKHSKEEIWSIVKDKEIEWGDWLSEKAIESAEGGLLKKLIAAANIAKWISKIGILNSIPFSGVIINMVVEYIVAGIKSGLGKIEHTLHSTVEDKKAIFDSAVGKLLAELNSVFSSHNVTINTEHFWGTDQFKVITEKDGQSKVFYGSLEHLVEAVDNNTLQDFASIYITDISSAYGISFDK